MPDKAVFIRRVDADLKPDVPIVGGRRYMIEAIAGAALRIAVQGRDRWSTDNQDTAGRSFQIALVRTMGMEIGRAHV